MTAVDNNDDIVLIEIKKHYYGIIYRKEVFKFQEIRYVTSYSTIYMTEELAKR